MRRRIERWVTGVSLVGIGGLLLALIWGPWTGLWAASWFGLALALIVGLDLLVIAWLRAPLFEFARRRGVGAFVCRVAGGPALDDAVELRAGDNAIAEVVGAELTVYSAEGDPVMGPLAVSSVEAVAVAGLVERKALRFTVDGTNLVLVPLARFGPLRDGTLRRLRDAVDVGLRAA